MTQEFVLYSNQTLARAEKIRVRLITEVLPLYKGRTIRGDDFQEFLGAVAKRLSKKVPHRQSRVLEDSLRDLVGRKLTAALLEDAFWRLAGNEDRLVRFEAVPPWNRQAFREWVPVEVVRVRPHLGGRHGSEMGHEFTFKVLAGSPCPLEIRRWVRPRYAAYLAYFKDDDGLRGFGFQRVRPGKIPPYPFFHEAQFYGLRCMALIDPALCTMAGPDFKVIGFTPGMAAWNRTMHRRRARLEPKYACPYGITPAEPCYACYVGKDRCPAATHPKTYRLKTCARCQQRAPHDPDDKLHDYCVVCRRKEFTCAEVEEETT